MLDQRLSILISVPTAIATITKPLIAKDLFIFLKKTLVSITITPKRISRPTARTIRPNDEGIPSSSINAESDTIMAYQILCVMNVVFTRLISTVYLKLFIAITLLIIQISFDAATKNRGLQKIKRIIS